MFSFTSQICICVQFLGSTTEGQMTSEQAIPKTGCVPSQREKSGQEIEPSSDKQGHAQLERNSLLTADITGC